MHNLEVVPLPVLRFNLTNNLIDFEDIWYAEAYNNVSVEWQFDPYLSSITSTSHARQMKLSRSIESYKDIYH
jgi:hypothetical protein